MIFGLLAGIGSALFRGIGSAAKATAEYKAKQAEAKRQQDMTESENRQNRANAKKQITQSSSSGAGGVDTSSVNLDSLDRYDSGTGSEYIKKPSFLGSVFSGIGGFLASKAGRNMFGG